MDKLALAHVMAFDVVLLSTLQALTIEAVMEVGTKQNRARVHVTMGGLGGQHGQVGVRWLSWDRAQADMGWLDWCM